MLGAVSMHGAEARLSPAFRSVAGRRLSPACGSRAMPSPRPLRRRQFELEKLRELARCDEFSDSESDGVDSEEEDEDVDFRETVYVPFRRPEAASDAQRAADRHAARRLHKMLAVMKKKATAGKDRASPKGDDWTLVDKSPTFESVAEGKTELGGESWFVQDRE